LKEITLDTKIADLLNDYEGMKDILIDINPKFKKLNNPIWEEDCSKGCTGQTGKYRWGYETIRVVKLG